MAQFKPSWLLYGATGYTGTLIADMAKARGAEPILAGRNAEKLKALAEKLGLKSRSFDIEDRMAADKGLLGIKLVLNCAGPFTQTGVPLAQAAIRNGVHYLDIAGEVHAVRALQRLDERAKEDNVMVLPGVAFGCMPGEALLCYIKDKRPGLVRAQVATAISGGASKGTIRTMFESLQMPGYTRDRGQLAPAKPGETKLTVDFGTGGKRVCMTNPWRSELFTAGIGSAIAHLETYTAYPWYVGDLFRKPEIAQGKGLLGKLVSFGLSKMADGPNPTQRAKNKSYVWAEGIDEDGRKAGGVISGPDAYEFTALCALYAVDQVLKGKYKGGFTTCAELFGSDPLKAIPGINFAAANAS
jgi:short subunit dehydrogenase-like uncharacterized protein